MADADLTYELTAIPKLLAPILDGSADLVLGERLTEANRSTMPLLHRYVGTPVLSYLVRRAKHGGPDPRQPVRIPSFSAGATTDSRPYLDGNGICVPKCSFAWDVLVSEW